MFNFEGSVACLLSELFDEVGIGSCSITDSPVFKTICGVVFVVPDMPNPGL